ncbi:TPA: hypothetical protein MW242_002640 [Acinetobacter baumannii]|nr:hypothetical protein [Acinetobacter baumannii]
MENNSIESHLLNLCKAKALMTYMACNDPEIDPSKSHLENWAMAFDLISEAMMYNVLDQGQIEQLWEDKTGQQFIVWGKFESEPAQEVINLIQEEFDCQTVHLQQVREILDGKSLSEV